MWYLICFIAGIVLGALVAMLRQEFRCRSCCQQEKYEQFL